MHLLLENLKQRRRHGGGGAEGAHRSAGRGHDDSGPVERVSTARRLHAIQRQLRAHQEDGQAHQRVQQAVPAWKGEQRRRRNGVRVRDGQRRCTLLDDQRQQGCVVWVNAVCFFPAAACKLSLLLMPELNDRASRSRQPPTAKVVMACGVLLTATRDTLGASRTRAEPGAGIDRRCGGRDRAVANRWLRWPRAVHEGPCMHAQSSHLNCTRLPPDGSLTSGSHFCSGANIWSALIPRTAPTCWTHSQKAVIGRGSGDPGSLQRVQAQHSRC